MARNYYVCKIDDDYIKLVQCLNNKYFMIPEPENGFNHTNFIFDIKENDILLFKFKEKLIAYGRVVRNDTHNNLLIVNAWIGGMNIYHVNIGAAHESGSYYPIKEVDREFALSKMEEIGFTF